MLVRNEAACIFMVDPFYMPKVQMTVCSMDKESMPQWTHAPLSNTSTPVRVHVQMHQIAYRLRLDSVTCRAP
jgi:hypothetical protein